jgi:hypothetical protein
MQQDDPHCCYSAGARAEHQKVACWPDQWQVWRTGAVKQLLRDRRQRWGVDEGTLCCGAWRSALVGGSAADQMTAWTY